MDANDLPSVRTPFAGLKVQVGGSFSVKVNGEICDECCESSGKMEKTWSAQAEASGSVGVTATLGEDIKEKYATFEVAGFAGVQASGSFGASGSGSFSRSCGESPSGSGSGKVGGTVGLKGGAELTFKAKAGHWDWTLGTTGVTIAGNASSEVTYKFSCNLEEQTCQVTDFGEFNTTSNINVSGCFLGACINHTF